MLARERAAELDHCMQHLLARLLDLVEHLAVAKVEEDVWVQVAVAGVKDVGDRQLVMHADLADRRQHLRQL